MERIDSAGINPGSGNDQGSFGGAGIGEDQSFQSSETGRSSKMESDTDIGSIERRNQRVYVAANDDLNVVGMSFLSTLRRWSVEGRWLILEP